MFAVKPLCRCQSDEKLTAICVSSTVGHRENPSSCHSTHHTILNSNNNKSAQSNLGRGLRRGTVAHVRRKVPTDYNGTPQIRPQKYPSRAAIPKPHYLPHPWTRPTYVVKRHPDLICRFSTMHWTDRYTYRQIVHGKVWSLYATVLRQRHGLIIITSLPKVIWKQGRVAALWRTGRAVASMHSRNALRAVRGGPVRRGVHSWICTLRPQRCCVCLSFVEQSHKPQSWSWKCSMFL